MSNPGTLSQPATQPKITAAGDRATHVRWRIIAILMFIMAVTALCRLNLSIAGKYIQEEFAFSTVTMGWLFSAFLLGYALFQIPWGYVGDEYGPRRILTISILIWTVGTVAMGVAPRFAVGGALGALWAFIVVRFVTGLGEAAVSPNVTRVIASWTAPRERGLASGLQIAGLGLGGTLTPILISWTVAHWGWRISFYLCAALGLLVIAVWRVYATDRPEEHRGVNAIELERIRPGAQSVGVPQSTPLSARHAPWGKMLSSLSVWGLILGYCCQGYAFYVYYNWFYIYVVKVRGLTDMRAAVWTSTPFMAMALLSPMGGLFSDRVGRKLGRRRGRQCGGWVGMGLSATLLWVGTHTANTTVALPLIAAAAGFNMFAGANFWAACIDLAPNYSASLSALMNTWGNLGGWISPITTAYVATRFGWSRSLDLAAAVTVCAGLLWFLVDAGKTIEEQSA